MLAAACDDPGEANSDGRLTCPEVYTAACRSAFDGGCMSDRFERFEDRATCIASLSERPRAGDVTGEFGEGMYGCRWYDPTELDLDECYALTAHQTCANFDEVVAFGWDFARFCVAGFAPRD